jgi:hypothetical protein
MLTKLASRIKWPTWVANCPRYKDLDILDRWLDGTFYDISQCSFYDEVRNAATGELNEIADRRPSAQFRLPKMVAHWAARSLFSGRSIPQIRHPNKSVRRLLKEFASTSQLNAAMLEACYKGSVGSVFMSFRMEAVNDPTIPPDITEDMSQEEIDLIHSLQAEALRLEAIKECQTCTIDNQQITLPRVKLEVWPAKFCWPQFDGYGALTNMRIAYVAPGYSLIQLGFPRDHRFYPIKASARYWFIRDMTFMDEVTYLPVAEQKWDPVVGFKGEPEVLADGSNPPQSLIPFPSECYTHNFGFVPGQWIKNLSGGTDPDGASTWSDALPNVIEMDFTLSQAGRGTRYNCAPELVIQGDLNGNNASGGVTRGPTQILHMAPGRKDPDGNTVSPSDAKLLEMSGTGIDAALKLVNTLRMQALEQISAPRKDPEKMKGPLSGAAMQHLDEDNIALLNELREAYGENGCLPLIRKLVMAAVKIAKFPDIRPGDIYLQWPTMLKPSAGEISQLVTAFSLAINPLNITIRGMIGGNAEPDTHGSTSETGGITKPAQTITNPDGSTSIDPEDQLDFSMVKLPEQYMIVKPEEARAYMARNLEVYLLGEGLAEEHSSGDDSNSSGSGRNSNSNNGTQDDKLPPPRSATNGSGAPQAFLPSNIPTEAPAEALDTPLSEFGMTIMPPVNVS